MGRFRRAHLVPVPQVNSLDELNQFLKRACEKDDQRTITGQQESVSTRWREEIKQLLALPPQPFATWEVSHPVVNAKGLVTVKGNHYSAPITLVGQAVEAQIHAQSIVLFKKGQCVAEHQRCYGQHQAITLLDHYLPLLKHKPGALPGSVALHQAKLQQQWPMLYEEYWQQLIRQNGQQQANSQMVDFLWWARDVEQAKVLTVLNECLPCGSYQLDAIKLMMRRQDETPPTTALDHRSLGDLTRYERPISGITHYDQLLTPGGTLS